MDLLGCHLRPSVVIVVVPITTGCIFGVGLGVIIITTLI